MPAGQLVAQVSEEDLERLERQVMEQRVLIEELEQRPPTIEHTYETVSDDKADERYRRLVERIGKIPKVEPDDDQ